MNKYEITYIVDAGDHERTDTASTMADSYEQAFEDTIGFNDDINQDNLISITIKRV